MNFFTKIVFLHLILIFLSSLQAVNGQKPAGYHTATFDASGLSSGVYLYKLTTPSFTQTKKMLLIK